MMRVPPRHGQASWRSAFLASLAILLCPAGAARAADPVYLGVGRIEGATRAPWADPAHPLDPGEPARLQARLVLIGRHAIVGPPPLPCPEAHYRLIEAPPDMLFQGAFGEMHEKDRSIDPAALAASLGFHAGAVRTLETGCELDFHFIDGATAEIGLNDYVYRLKRQR